MMQFLLMLAAGLITLLVRPASFQPLEKSINADDVDIVLAYRRSKAGLDGAIDPRNSVSPSIRTRTLLPAGVGLVGNYLNSASAAIGMGTLALGGLAIGSMAAAKNVAGHGITPLLNHQGMRTRRDGDPVIYHDDQENLYHPYQD